MIYITGILCLSFTFCVSAHNFNIQKRSDPDPEIEPSLSDYTYNAWCKFQPNGFNCKPYSQSRFYYDTKLQGCKVFSYGGCPTRFNNFGTLSECNAVCRDLGIKRIRLDLPDIVNCRLQPAFGDCDEYHPMFYFDLNQRTCRGFSYSGCGGNKNRFSSSEICNSVCAMITAY